MNPVGLAKRDKSTVARVGDDIGHVIGVVAGSRGALQLPDKLLVVDDDLALLEAWRAGDLRAGQDLFARHFSDIYRFFEHKIPNDAEDLAQRTFTACVAAREKFRGQATFRTYLFAIARNQLYTHLRNVPRGEHVDFEVTSIADMVTSLSSRVGRAREIEQLRAVLRELPAEQQLLLELHYWHDLDASALAEVFEVPPGTIRVRLLRARKALRGRLDPAMFVGATDGLVASLARADSEDDK
jgi:RNA polymerase sigma factor (sigma-70 family)